jgi:cell division protein FtsL
MIMSENEPINSKELEKLRQEAEISEALQARERFKEEAQKRGLDYKEDRDAYVDENGDLLDPYGERL